MRKVPKWLDRTELKANLKEWLLSSEESCYCVNVLDSQEIHDIVKWIPGQDQNNKVVEVYFDSDTEVRKYSLLESIVNEIGLERFNSFNMLTTIGTPQDSKVIIQQTMGDNIKSEDNVTFSSNTQTVNLTNVDPTTVRLNNLENNINSIFRAFLNDIRSISQQKPIIIICCYNGEYSKIDQNFKSWFDKYFIRKLLDIRNIKIITLLQDKEAIYLNSIDIDSHKVIKDLSLSDIMKDSEKYISQHEGFCNGLIDPVSQNTTYQKYKLQLTFALDKQMSL